MSKKKKAGQLALKTSVKSYQGDIDAEKQKMGDYAKKMGSSVRSLQKEFKGHAKYLQEAAAKMNEEGAARMQGKVNKFKAEIRDQGKENKEAIAYLGNGVKLLLSKVNQKKKDFHAYQQGPFQGYIKAFWG